jgi:hypothetical protein
VPEGVKAQADRANALIEQAKVAKAANEAAGGNELVRPLVPPPRPPNPNIVTGDFDPRNPSPPEFGDPRDTLQFIYRVRLERFDKRRPFGWVCLTQVEQRSDILVANLVTHWVRELGSVCLHSQKAARC